MKRDSLAIGGCYSMLEGRNCLSNKVELWFARGTDRKAIVEQNPVVAASPAAPTASVPEEFCWMDRKKYTHRVPPLPSLKTNSHQTVKICPGTIAESHTKSKNFRHSLV